MNFLDLQIPKEYAHKRYEELVKECYFITKYTNTPYSDVLQMTTTERGLILKFLMEDAEKINKQQEENRRKLQEQRNNR